MSSWSQGLQVVGTAVGYYYGGPIGGMVGGMVGSYVGATFDPTTQLYGPRKDDQTVITSSYGVPLALLFGDNGRVSGNVVWNSGIQEVEKNEEVSGAGGKGGGGGTELNTYTYNASFAIALGRGPLHNIRRVWANKKLVFDLDWLDAYLLSLLDTADELEAKADILHEQYQDNPTVPDYLTWETRVREERDAILEQYADAVLSTADAKAGGAPWSLRAGVDMAPGGPDYIAFYPGTATQDPDPVMEGALGAGDTCPFRGTGYVVISTQLANYGNVMPSVEFEVDGLPYNTAAGIINYICNEAGLEQGDFSIGTGVGSAPVDGYCVARASSAYEAIRSMEATYFFDTVEQCGNVRFVQRGHGIAATLETKNMAARQSSDGSMEDALSVSDEPDYLLLDRATVTYRDVNLDYINNTQSANRTGGNSQNIRNEESPIIMSASQARRIADRLLWEGWVGRKRAEFSMTDRWRWMHTGTVVSLPIGDSLQPFRITDLARGANGVLKFMATREDPYSYEGSLVGAEGARYKTKSPIVGNSFVYIYNAPILLTEDPDAAFSWVLDGAGDGWRGALAYRSTDGGATYKTLGSTRTRNTTGSVATSLPAASCDLWDRTNTVDVTLLYHGHELNSASEEEVLKGANACWLGAADGSHGEVLQFSGAEVLTDDPKVYRLSGFLRGRRGTEHEVGLHNADDVDEVFVMIGPGGVHAADYTAADWDVVRGYKGVSVYQSIIGTPSVQVFTNTGERAMCRSPVFGRGERDGSNNLTATWVRRIRGYPPVFGHGLVPLDEPTEAYEVDVLVGAAVVRTISTATPSTVYTATMQTADGITPGDAVHIKVYQISATRGRGHPGDFTI